MQHLPKRMLRCYTRAAEAIPVCTWTFEMTQSVTERPDPTLPRKAAIVNGGAVDHSGHVEIRPIPNFDLNRTIFQTLEGAAARFIMTKRIAKDVFFDRDSANSIRARYEQTREEVELPKVNTALLEFLVSECDFDVEHAEGSFLDHLYFGFEYSVQHYPDHSPIVMLLHSILGTGTNTFAMSADKIPKLQALISEFEFRHVEAFPSMLRLLYVGDIFEGLEASRGKISSLHMHRVIDNMPIELSGDDVWIQLNYQLMHLIDFLPVANWRANRSDNSLILFRRLYGLLKAADKLEANVHFTAPKEGSILKRFPSRVLERKGEIFDLGNLMVSLLPTALVKKASARSVQKFSERIGHSLDYELR